MTATLTSPSIKVDPAIANLETVADLLERLGGIPPERVRMKPYPGTATEQDVIAAEAALRQAPVRIGRWHPHRESCGIL